MLVHPKDKNKKEQQCGVVYEIKCEDCKEKYVGETARTLGTRLKELGLGIGEICILHYIAIFPMNIAIHIAIFLFEFFMKQKHHSVKP